MTKVRTLQTSFNAGVIDPEAHGRADLAHYYRGLLVGKNLVPSPLGGIKRRGGTLSVGGLPKTLNRLTAGITITCPNGGTTANANDDDEATKVITTTAISTINPYVVVQYDLGTTYTVKYADMVGLKISAGVSDEFHIQYSTNGSTWFFLGGGAGFPLPTVYTVAKTHRVRAPGGAVSARYLRVVRSGSTDLGAATAELAEFSIWTEAASYGESRLIEFAFDVDEYYALSMTDRNIDIYRNKVYQVSIRSPYTSAQLANINWTQSVDIVLFFHEDVQTRELARYTDTDWQFTAVSFSNIPTYDYGSGAEAVISTTRGWPRSGGFYGGRLYLGGLKGRPGSYLASKTNDYYNLDLGTGLDDEGLFRTLDTDQLNAIRQVKGGDHLLMFTTGSEFFCPNNPITPDNVALLAQSNYGIANVRPEQMEGATYYVQFAGNVIREFQYTFAEKEGYISRPASLLASHLIVTPVDIATLSGEQKDGGSMLYAVNSDGTVAVFNRLRTEEVAAWFLWETQGLFKRVAVIQKQLYFHVERVIDGTTVQFLEVYDEDLYMDCAATGTESPATDTITGLDHLDGETCRARGDGYVLENVTPSAGGATLSREVANWEVGLDMNPLLTTLPLNVDFQNGPILAELKKIIKASLKLKDSNGVRVNGIALPDRVMGAVLDTPLTPFSGIKKTHNNLGGWQEEATLTIDQVDPLPFNLLALSLEVEA